MRTVDLYWAAGFIEGEGGFSPSLRRSNRVSASQVNPECLLRLQKMFGGTIAKRRNDRAFKNAKPLYVWTVCGSTARGVMLTLFVLMSKQRQQQIAQAMEKR